jgi:hypothetical protein
MPYLQPDDGDNSDNEPKLFPRETKSIARCPQEADWDWKIISEASIPHDQEAS